ncbi:MAG: hypothetical protein U0638_11950 [Phycisphaerales bacterium]
MAKKKTAKKSKRTAKSPARPDANQAAKSMVDLIASRTSRPQ